MPRIRKKTSNRASTHDRAKLRHKVAEGRKKNRKLAKKNVQWKSRVPKDPGIPNNLPFKDQILSEIAEERRKAEEEKQLRKSGKKAASKAAAKSDVDDEAMSEDGDEDAAESSLGINALVSARTLSASKAAKPTSVVEDAAEEEEEEPLLIDPSIPDIGAALDAADIWLYVLDARDPLAHRSAFIESLATAKDKKLVFLLNKIDVAPRESVTAWLAFLRQTHPTFPFRSASAHLPPLDEGNSKGKAKLSLSLNDALGSAALVEYLLSSSLTTTPTSVSVAVIGLPNVGKSAVINSLCANSRLGTYKPDSNSTKTSTTTTYPQPISFTATERRGGTIRFIDTPGLEALPKTHEATKDGTGEEEDVSAIADTLLRSRGRLEKMKNPDRAARYIISRANAEDLMLHYNTPAFVAGSAESFLSGHARATGRLKKGGVLDIIDSARSLLRDWRVGKFPYYTSPPPTSLPPTSSSSNPEPADEETLLSTLRTRKELRTTGGGLIRLNVGSVDVRDVRLYAPPLPTPAPTPARGLGKATVDEEVMDEDEEAEDEAEDSDEEDVSPSPSPSPPPPSKRKRNTADPSPASALKRSKNARSQPSTPSTPSAPAPAPVLARKVSFASKPAPASAVKSKPAGKSKASAETTAGKPKSALKEPKPKVSKPASVKSSTTVSTTSASAKKAKPTTTGTEGTGNGEAYDFKAFF